MSNVPKPPASDKVGAVQAAPKPSGILVKAVRPGFYNGFRYDQNSKPFTVPGWHKVGNWMMCVDEKLEKEHQLKMRDEKKKAREIAKYGGKPEKPEEEAGE